MFAFVLQSPKHWCKPLQKTLALCSLLSFLRQQISSFGEWHPICLFGFCGTSSLPPNSAKTAVFCIFVFCLKQMVLKIPCWPLRQLETPWGAVKPRVGITDLRGKKGFGKSSSVSVSSKAAAQARLLLTLGFKVRAGEKQLSGLPAPTPASQPPLAIRWQLTQQCSRTPYNPETHDMYFCTQH